MKFKELLEVINPYEPIKVFYGNKETSIINASHYRLVLKEDIRLHLSKNYIEKVKQEIKSLLECDVYYFNSRITENGMPYTYIILKPTDELVES